MGRDKSCNTGSHNLLDVVVVCVDHNLLLPNPANAPNHILVHALCHSAGEQDAVGTWDPLARSQSPSTP